MIQVRYLDTANSLDRAAKEINRKLKAMVAGFTKEMTTIVVENTPIGDEDRLENDEGYRGLYRQRWKMYKIPMEVGYHAGSWRLSITGHEILDATIYPAERPPIEASDIVKSSEYQLGTTFYIMSNGPGIIALENGESPWAPNGIVEPSMQEIAATYKVNLKGYFDRA